MNKQLKFKDGKFKIMVLGDIHERLVIDNKEDELKQKDAHKLFEMGVKNSSQNHSNLVDFKFVLMYNVGCLLIFIKYLDLYIDYFNSEIVNYDEGQKLLHLGYRNTSSQLYGLDAYRISASGG